MWKVEAGSLRGSTRHVNRQRSDVTWRRMASLTPRMPDYRRVILNARPPRLATTIFGGEGWEVTVQRVLEGYARCWGGAGNVIVPIQGSEIHPAVWRVLKRYDADRWAYYAVTRHGQQMARPDVFTTWLDKQATLLAEQHGGTIDEAREMLTADHIMRQPQNGPPEGLDERVLREMAPDAPRGDLFNVSFTADATPGPHLGLARTPVATALRLPSVRDLPVHLQLLVRSRTGDISPSYRQELTMAGVTIEDTPVPIGHTSALLALAWGGHASSSYRLRSAVVSRLSGEPTDPLTIADDEYQAATPFGNTIAGCGVYRVWDPHWEERAFVVVAGSTANDFALALALDRCYSAAAWLPTDLEDEYADVMTQALAETLYQFGDRHKPPLLMTSTSIDNAQLDDVIRSVRATPWGSELLLSIIDPTAIPLMPAQRIFERHGFGREEHIVPFLDDVLVGRLPAVIPSGPETPNPDSLTWQVDVSVEGFTIPSRWCLNERVQHVQGWPDANMRSAFGGLSYMSTRMGFVAGGLTLDQRVARPRLRLPTPADAIELIARSAGLTARLSAAGRFTIAMIDLFGGLADCGKAFRDPAVVAVLNGYLSGASSEEEPGVFLESVSRRFLTLGNVCQLARIDEEASRVTLDGLLAQRVLDRGLVLSCERCSYAAFYRLEALSRTFTCARCASIADILQGRWKMPLDEPSWYYALDEVVFQSLRLDGWDVVHGLLELKKDAHDFQWLAQTELRRGDELLGELDLLAFGDGIFMVGEAKRGDRLENSARAERQAAARLVSMAIALTVDTLVLASRVSWHQRTREVIMQAAQAHDLDVRFLEGVGA